MAHDDARRMNEPPEASRQDPGWRVFVLPAGWQDLIKTLYYFARPHQNVHPMIELEVHAR